MGGVWQRSQLFGNLGGAREWLARYGVALAINETSEVLANNTGGIHQSSAYDGLTTIDLQVDTKRAFNWYGGTFNASALQIHGVNLSAQNLGTLQTASGIEADSGFRLWELWYQQYFDYNQIDVKVGNQSLDQEFIVSQYAGLFVNTMFGWPMLTSADLLGGGPAYPLAALGLRFRAQPSGSPLTMLAGIFDDNPSGVNPQQIIPAQDSQQLNINGTNLRAGDRALLILELQYSCPSIGELEYVDRRAILPATYKIGFWYDFGDFADQEYGTDGLSLASSSSSQTPQQVSGNYSFYVVVDQLVWRESAESAQGIGVFARVMTAPSKQNLISFSMNAGVSWHAPFRHREYDVAGFAIGKANVSDRVRALDRDAATFASNSALPQRESEVFAELTYQYQVVPWWTLQPDAQYVVHPGAGAANPNDVSHAIGDEFVFGLRTNIAL